MSDRILLNQYLDEPYSENWLKLDLGDVEIEGLIALGEKLESEPNITILDLGGSNLANLSVEEIEAFVKGLQHTSITSLDLCFCCIKEWNEEQISVFFDSLKDTKIEALDLDGNFIDEWCVDKIRAFSHGIGDTNIDILASFLPKKVEKLVISMSSDLKAQINSVKAAEITNELYTSIEHLDDLLSLLSFFSKGAYADTFTDTINDGYTAILEVLFTAIRSSRWSDSQTNEVDKNNLDLFVKFSDKIACISDNDLSFEIANFLAFELESKSLLYRFLDKVSLGDEHLRAFYQGILIDDIDGLSCEDAFALKGSMTDHEMREKAACKLLEEGSSDQPLSEEEVKFGEVVPPSVITLQGGMFGLTPGPGSVVPDGQCDEKEFKEGPKGPVNEHGEPVQGRKGLQP